MASDKTYVNGGGITNTNGHLTVTSSTITSNQADSDNNSSGIAGGIYHEGASAVTDVSGTTLTSNRSPTCAGMNVHMGKSTLTEVTLSSNRATGGIGGGICAGTGGILTITRSTIKENSSKTNGGGIYAAGQVSLIDSTVGPNNTATSAGGGIYIDASYVFTATNSTVSSNISSGSTGGIHAVGTMKLRFVTVTGNTGSPRANLYTSSTANTSLYAVAISKPMGGGTNCGDSQPFASYADGYNRVSDSSCSFSGGTENKTNVTIMLKSLAANGGATWTHLPIASGDNTIVDIIPKTECLAFFNPAVALDQRSLVRPHVGKVGQDAGNTTDAKCDVGAVELGRDKHYVCGPPLAGNKRVQRPLPGADDSQRTQQVVARRCHRGLRHGNGDGDG